MQYNQNPTADSRILSDGPDTNYGSDALIDIGCYSTTSKRHTAIKFDLSSISSTARINYGHLSLYYATDYSNNQRTLSLYRLKRNWTSAGITWNKYDGSNAWQTVGGYGANDIDISTINGSATIPSSATINSEVQIPIDRSEIQKFIDGTYTNYGWLLMVDTESDDLWSYHSLEATTAAYRPRLVLFYNEEAGSPAVSPFFNFFKNFENPWMKGGVWQPNNKGLVTI